MPKPPRPMQLEDLLELRVVGRVALSPDSRTIAFELKRLDGNENQNYTQLMRVDTGLPTARSATSAHHAAGADHAAGALRAAATRHATAAHRAAVAHRVAAAPAGSGRPTPSPRAAAPPAPSGAAAPTPPTTLDAATLRQLAAAARPLTRAGKWNDTLPKFSPDGRRLAFISTRDKGACLFVLPLEGGDAIRLTEPDGFVHDFDWSPDGARIAFLWQAMSEREKLERDGKHDELRRKPQFKHITRLTYKLDGAGYWNGCYKHIHAIDVDAALAGGGGGRSKAAKPRQLTRGDFDHAEPRFSPDGRWIAFACNRDPNADVQVGAADLYVMKSAGGQARKISTGGGSCAGLAWSPDSRRIAFLRNPGIPKTWWKYATTAWATTLASGETSNLAPRFDEDSFNTTLGDVTVGAFDATPPMWTADGDRLLFIAGVSGATHVFSCAARGGDVRAEFQPRANLMFPHQPTPSGPIALCVGDAVNPGDVHLLHPARAWRLERLTAVNGETLSRIAVQPPEPFVVRSSGVEVQGWVIKPPGFRAGRKHPSILQIHGGPHTQYGESFFHEMQWLAACGYVVAFSNPRGSTGRGVKFRAAIHGGWGQLDYKDVMAAAEWLAARPYIDRKRMGVTGGSYGGYMTNWIVSHTDRFKAAVTQRSVVNIESMFGTSDYGHDLEFDFEGTPWRNVERLRRCSPLTYVANIRTPLLIEHEEQDYRCMIEQAEQLYTALKLLGRTVEFVRFEGESHGLSRTGRPQNRLERLRRIRAWFDRFLK